MNVILKDWQARAYNDFIRNNNKGIIEACTGSGKTILGITLINNNLTKKVLVVVPTVVLQEQWKEEIIKHTCIVPGLVGNGHKDERHITVAIVNSIREMELKYDILILDECHRFLSDENKKFLINNKFEKIMALSATVERQDGKTYEFLNLNKIFQYTQRDAILNKDISGYKLINTDINFTEDEQMRYNAADNIVKEIMPLFKNDIKAVFSAGFHPLKTRLRRAIIQRKTIVNNAENKIKKTIELVQLHSQDKIIIFCELIKTANQIKKDLEKLQIKSVMYHSKDKNKDNIEKFRTNEVRILIAVKSLDEGLNVPDANIGIIVAGNSSARQIIQRIGRLLRRKDTEVKIYQIFVAKTIDERWMKKRNLSLR